MVADLDADNFEVRPVLNSLGTIGGYVPNSKQITEVWKSVPTTQPVMSSSTSAVA